MATINIYDFSDKLNADSRLREKFIEKYVDNLVNTMDPDDLVRSWAELMYESLYSEVKDGGSDGLIEQAAHEFPEWIEQEFNVNPALARV
jgi:hypothetical protein